MGLIDAFTADERVELKVGELYDILRVAANNGKTAEFMKNAVDCEVPYNYIREMITGKKEEAKESSIHIEIPRGILEAQVREAMKELEHMTEFECMAAGQEEPAETLKVSCGECRNRETCSLDIGGEDEGRFPSCFEKEESEGKEG